jgi:hypothetical protein
VKDDKPVATGRVATSGDHADSLVTGAREGLTSGARLPEGERSRVGGGVAADEWGRPVSAGGVERGRTSGREGDGPHGPRGREERGARGRRSGLDSAQPRGGDFPFSFSISISISISFISFFF